MGPIHPRLTVISLGMLSVLLGGCFNLGGGTQQTTKFYVLSSLDTSKGDLKSGTSKNDMAIGVHPVKLPQYVDRPQIVTRSSSNEIETAPFDHWAEPLEDSLFSRVLAENLAVLLSTDRVVTYPWMRSMRTDYQVVVEVTRFDGALGGDVWMRARWAVLEGDGQKVLADRDSTFKASTGAATYEAMVSALSGLVADLSREIAVALEGIHQGQQ